MNLLKRIFRKNKKEQTVVLAKDLADKMIEERKIVVSNYNEKNCKDPKISMFH